MDTCTAEELIDRETTETLIQEISLLAAENGRALPEGMPRILALISQLIVKQKNLEFRIQELERQSDNERTYRMEQSEY